MHTPFAGGNDGKARVGHVLVCAAVGALIALAGLATCWATPSRRHIPEILSVAAMVAALPVAAGSLILLWWKDHASGKWAAGLVAVWLLASVVLGSSWLVGDRVLDRRWQRFLGAAAAAAQGLWEERTLDYERQAGGQPFVLSEAGLTLEVWMWYQRNGGSERYWVEVVHPVSFERWLYDPAKMQWERAD